MGSISTTASSVYHGLRRRLRPLKRGAIRAREEFNRWRHKPRRRAALRLLSRVRPESLVFVCLGNVCRSPYAEWIAREALAGRGITVSSAGFIGPGRAPPERALAVARGRGVDHADARSCVITHDGLESVDLAVVFDPAHARRLRRLAPTPVIQLSDLDPRWWGERVISDPWDGSENDFRAAFDRIDAGVAALLRGLPEGRRRERIDA